MKKTSTPNVWKIGLALFLLVVATVCILCACSKQEQPPVDTEAPHVHDFGEGEVTQAPTCTENGVKSYTCSCGETKTEELTALGHAFGDWSTTVESTLETEGLERRDCERCDFYEERTLSKIPVKYTITIDSGKGGVLYMGVAEDGVYSIPTPIKVGYIFLGWKDSEGNPFASEGTVSADISIFAQWQLEDTDSLDELKERAAAGTDLIHLTADIVIDSPIYVTGKTRIYSDEAFKLIRDKNYGGDLFVIGQTEDGTSSILLGSVAELTLGKEGGSADEILLTVDGNRDEVEVDVVGSAFFLIYGGNLNMYDGVSIVNHQKVGNERSYQVPEVYIGTSKTVGGAVMIIAKGSAFHMYGGVIENNGVNTAATTDENGEAVNLSGYGGAIYNLGAVRIHKGTLSNNEANRGGAIYSSSVVKILSGVLENNFAGNKGGAICTSGSLSADTFISTEGAEENTVVFRGNKAGKQGGAILSYYDSPVVIYDGVLFEANEAQTGSGGAISTSGPVTAYNTVFRGNLAKSYGGAIYHTYAGSDVVRELLLTGCTFAENQAYSGGAITLGSSKDEGVGSYTELTNCTFTANAATSKSGVGGAIYVTEGSVLVDKGSSYVENVAYRGGAICVGLYEQAKKDTVLASVTGSVFQKNTAKQITEESDTKSRGGAIYVSEYVTVEVTDAVFEENTAVQYGGAISVARESTLKLKGSEFKTNTTNVNGGALWGYTDSVFAIETTTFNGNTAGANGGAVFAYSSLTLTDSEFWANSAVNGGAVYTVAGLTAINTEFKNNTVSLKDVTSTSAVYLAAGSAIYADEGAVSSVSGCVFESNTAYVPAASASKDTRIYGGAVCLFGKDVVMDIANSSFKNNGFANPSTEALGYNAKTYGGAIGATKGAVVSITDGSSFDGNSASYGGAIAAATNKKAKVTVHTVSFTANAANNCGGAIYLNDAQAEITNMVAKNNKATNTGGGVIYASSCNGVAITGSTFEENETSNSGGVISVSTPMSIADSTFTKNSATKKGGAIYASSTLTLTNCTFNENTAPDGGALFLNGGETSAVGCTFSKNTATSGGAVYVSENAMFKDGADTTVQVEGVDTVVQNSGSKFTENTASNGGAIYLAAVADPEADPDHVAGAAVLEGSEFKQNAAQSQGGAIYLQKGATLSDTDSLYEENVAYRGGAISVSIFDQAQKETVLVTVKGSVFKKNAAKKTTEDADSKTRGGAIYVAEYVSVEVINAVFEENTALQYGGAISVARESTLKLTGSEFKKNTSGTNGGALWGYTDASLVIEATTFNGNTTGTNGGAIYAYSFLTLTDSSFVENSAANGGAFYLNGGEATVAGCTFTNNGATANGGAIYVAENGLIHDGIDTDAAKNGSEYTGNHATNGGALYLAPVANPTKNPSHVGGAAQLEGSVFKLNSASEVGGAIHSIGGTVNIKDCDFAENEAGTRGGAISAESAVLTVNGGTMKGNHVDGAKSTYYAGAIDARTGTQAVITGTVFDGNIGYSGGAISSYGTDTSVTLNQVELKNNVGTNGAVYIGAGASVTVNDLNAHDNTTKSKGAVFYLTSGAATTLTVHSATLSGNTYGTSAPTLGFILINNAANVVNINKTNVTGSDVNENWDQLILNPKAATVNELTSAE